MDDSQALSFSPTGGRGGRRDLTDDSTPSFLFPSIQSNQPTFPGTLFPSCCSHKGGREGRRELLMAQGRFPPLSLFLSSPSLPLFFAIIPLIFPFLSPRTHRAPVSFVLHVGVCSSSSLGRTHSSSRSFSLRTQKLETRAKKSCFLASTKKSYACLPLLITVTFFCAAVKRMNFQASSPSSPMLPLLRPGASWTMASTSAWRWGRRSRPASRRPPRPLPLLLLLLLLRRHLGKNRDC